jgi:uncharacterized repeat protein (TIGR01451 family)
MRTTRPLVMAALVLGPVLILGLDVLLVVTGANLPPAHADAYDDMPFPRTPHFSALDPSPPANPVRLIFIHHSCGENWLANGDGGLGIALRDNNYFVSDTNYGWGPDGIGDYTDIGHWWTWFRGPNDATYLAALYSESGQHSSYSRLSTNPGGENTIIMFKSCFPNSYLGGNPDDPPTTGYNPLRGEDCASPHQTVGNAKGIYNDLLAYFATRQDKLFIVISAPPQVQNDTDFAHARNARAFNKWLVSDWLDDYPYNNVGVFDFYDVLTSNGGNRQTNDLGWATGNHHRYRNGTIEYITDQGSNYAAYAQDAWDSHPTAAGNQKATGEFVPLLNIYYHRWLGATSQTPQKAASAAVAQHGEVVTYTISLRGLAAPPAATVHLTDVVPTGLSYVPDSLTATTGIVTDTAAPILRWSGVLSPTPVVTVTYVVTVTATTPQAIINIAIIAAPGYETITRTAMVLANPREVYLPLAMRGY